MTEISPFHRSHQIAIALLFLTRLPWPSPPVWPPDGLARSLWAFPLVGALVGVLLGLAASGAAAMGFPPLIAALLTLGFGLLVTGGLHEDGLADCADGLGGGRDRPQKLVIMRDSRIGTYGVLALIVALGLRGAALEIMIRLDWTLMIFSFMAGTMVSRALMPVLISCMVPARPDGLGAGVGRPAKADVLIGCIVASLPLLALAALGHPGHAAMAGLFAVMGVFSVARLAQRMIGGYTGDVLGAAQMISETAIWVILCGR